MKTFWRVKVARSWVFGPQCQGGGRQHADLYFRCDDARRDGFNVCFGIQEKLTVPDYYRIHKDSPLDKVILTLEA